MKTFLTLSLLAALLLSATERAHASEAFSAAEGYQKADETVTDERYLVDSGAVCREKGLPMFDQPQEAGN